MPLRRVRKLANLLLHAVTSMTVDAFRKAATFLFEPTYKMRGQIHVSCDEVRVSVHPASPPAKESESMSNEELASLAEGKGTPGKMRGAKPTPRHKLAGAMPFVPVAAPLPQSAIVPPKLSYWGNNAYGDCVSAEEAFAKACYSPEIFVSDQTVIQWAARHGVLNGADLGDVLDMMVSDGFNVPPSIYLDGGKLAVDYSNEATLQAAIDSGPVKIAIDADALPSGAGNNNGWYATGQGRYPNTDHCVSLCGHGPAGWLFSQLGLPLPSSIAPTQTGYLLFTWSTIGFVDHAWLMGTCTEAWVRNPTTIINGPAPTPPVPPSPPTPTPTPTPATVGSLVLTEPLQPGTYPIGPGLALVVGREGAVNWQTILQIIIAIINGLAPLIPPTPTPTPTPEALFRRLPVM
jgi:hypothetical protein